MSKLKHLSEYHKKALELKYKGNSYQDLAETLNSQFGKSRKGKFSEQTIKDWFKESGTLCETYKLYEKEMDTIHGETMQVLLKAGVQVREKNFRLANEMLVALMGSQQDNVKLGAIKELLDRVEGKPKEEMDLSKEALSKMTPMERWYLVPYEVRLKLARKEYPEDAEKRLFDWIDTGV